jgi:hypothetical protein
VLILIHSTTIRFAVICLQTGQCESGNESLFEPADADGGKRPPTGLCEKKYWCKSQSLQRFRGRKTVKFDDFVS